MKKEIQEKFAKGEIGVFAIKVEGLAISVNLVEIEYGIDDRMIGFIEYGDGEKIWFRRKLRYTDEGATFKVNGYTYKTEEFLRV